MRVLYLTEESISFDAPLVRGGAIHVRNVVTGLRVRGHEVTLVDWNPSPERSYQHSVRPRSRFFEGAFRTFYRAVRVGSAAEAEVVVSKTRKTYLPGLLAARALSVPHAVHVGSTLGPVGGGLGARLDAASVGLRLRVPHDAYFVVCEAIADQLRARGVGGTIYDVRNAVDAERFRSAGGSPPAQTEHDGPVVGFVGGLHEYKGVYDLARAVERCECDVTVLFAGDGPERARLERRLDAAVFLGPVPYEEMPAVYHAIDVFVLPSHTEGLPRVILEAQATGTPVVATRVGGVPEVITDAETGRLVPAHDPGALAAALADLVADPAERERLGTNGQRAVSESFTWDALYDRYERALGEIVGATD